MKLSVKRTLVFLMVVITGQIQANERSLTWISEQGDSNEPTGRLSIMENIDAETVPDLKAVYKKSGGTWEFELEGKGIPLKMLGTPIWVDDSYLGFDSFFSKKSNWQYFCISKVMGLVPPEAQNVHNNYLIFKLDGTWQGLYFYTPLDCKNSVSADTQGLSIKYTVVKPMGHRVERRQLMIAGDGKHSDKLLSTGNDKWAERLKKAFHLEADAQHGSRASPHTNGQ